MATEVAIGNKKPYSPSLTDLVALLPHQSQAYWHYYESNVVPWCCFMRLRDFTRLAFLLNHKEAGLGAPHIDPILEVPVPTPMPLYSPDS